MTDAEFSQYVACEYDGILRFVRSRVGDDHDAEEIVQRTLLRLFRNRDTIDAARPGGFVFAALKHAVTDYWRKRGRHPRPGGLPEQLPQDSSSSFYPADAAAAEQTCRDALRDAFDALTPRERRAFLVCWRSAGDRARALERLGLAGGDRNARFKDYDGPLHHAKKKLNLALAPYWDALAGLGYERLWELITEVLAELAPEAVA